MPQGLKNSSKTFQALMNKVLWGAGMYANTHQDNIVITSDSFEEHLSQIRDVLERLRLANLTARASKTQFAREEAKCLGLVVENCKIVPDLDKVKAIENLPVCTSRKSVSAFLGVTGYYRRHIENYSRRAFPLTELTKKNKPDKFQTNGVEPAAFDDFEKALISLPVFQPPNLNVPFIVKADCSQFCCGAVLTKENDLGREHPIAYFAKKLLPRETNLSTVEKECRAIVLALKIFERYIFGVSVSIITDHSCLKWLMTMSPHNSRLMRWALYLQRYNIVDIKFKPGFNHTDADGLSRNIS